MGIQGLLPNVDNIAVNERIDSFKGKRVAIDTYGWLHKSAANCAESIVLGRPTKLHINYCIDRVKVLLNKGITPICIFDGATLPMKRITEEERSKKRAEARREIVKLSTGGRSYNSYLMRNLCQKALDITPTIAHQVLEVLRDNYNIECIVAPYEADAQLSYLSRSGYVDAVITEDSDMLVFGSRCTIYKYDDKTGSCRVIYWKDLHKSGIIPQRIFTYETFVLGCTLTGCDYVKSPQGVGIKTAMKLVQECNANLDKVVLQLQELGKQIPDNYSVNVQKALITFFHQTVFDPFEKKMVPLSRSELPQQSFKTDIIVSGVPIFTEFNIQMKKGGILECNRMNDFVGPIIEGELAKKICSGFIHPEFHLEYNQVVESSKLILEDQSEVSKKGKFDKISSSPISVEGSNVENENEKENLDSESKDEVEIEDLIKKSIGSPVNRMKSSLRLFPYEKTFCEMKKKRRAVWLNSKNQENKSITEINSLDNFAFQMN